MQFKEIIGQSSLKSKLMQQLQGNRLHHAHMLVGSMGYGTLGLAMAMAQYMFCSDPKSDDSCGQCINCRKVQSFQHLDLHITYPTFEDKQVSRHLLPKFKEMLQTQGHLVDSKDWLEFNDKKNLKIRKDEIQEILNTFELSSVEGGRRVHIIWLVEKMELEINKILKILEEPSPNSYFILIAESSDQILPTVLSRCIIYKVGALDHESMMTYAHEQYPNTSKELIEQAISYSEGDLIKLRRYMQDIDNEFSIEQVVLKLLRGLINFEARKASNFYNVIDAIDSLSKHTKEVRILVLEYLGFFFGELVSYRVLGRSKVSQILTQALSHYSEVYAEDQIELALEKIDQTINAIQRNADYKISFVSLCIYLGKIQNRKEMIHLLKKNMY